MRTKKGCSYDAVSYIYMFNSNLYSYRCIERLLYHVKKELFGGNRSILYTLKIYLCI